MDGGAWRATVHGVAKSWTQLSNIHFHASLYVSCRFPRWLSGKESTCNAEDVGSIPGLGRAPGEGNGNPLLYSCLENSKDRGTWRATVHGVAENQTRQSEQHLHFHKSYKCWANCDSEPAIQ